MMHEGKTRPKCEPGRGAAEEEGAVKMIYGHADGQNIQAHTKHSNTISRQTEKRKHVRTEMKHGRSGAVKIIERNAVTKKLIGTRIRHKKKRKNMHAQTRTLEKNPLHDHLAFLNIYLQN